MRAMVGLLFCAASLGLMACAEGVPSDPEAGKALDSQGGAGGDPGAGGAAAGGAGQGGAGQGGAGQGGVGGSAGSSAGQGGAPGGGSGGVPQGGTGHGGSGASGTAGVSSGGQAGAGQGGQQAGGAGTAGAQPFGGMGDGGGGAGGDPGQGGAGQGGAGQGGAGMAGMGGAPLVGQDCSVPIEVTLDASQSVTVEGSTVDTKDAFFGFCDIYGAHDLLYHLKAAADGNLEASVTPKDDTFDPALYGVSGVCSGVEVLFGSTSAPHDCAETFGPGAGESISFPVKTGDDVWIVVDASSKGGKPDGGPFTLTIAIKP